MRLLFLSDHLAYPGGVTTGATTYFLHVLPVLKNHGIDIRACFLRDRLPVAERLESRGVRPIFLNRAKWDPMALFDLLGLVQAEKIDIVHAAGMKGILLGRAAGHFRGRKVVIHLHDTSVPGPLFRMLHRAMAGWTDRCLVVSEAVGKLARGRFGIRADRVTVLYNGMDPDRFRNVAPDARERIRKEFGLPENAPVLAVIGRLSREKGQAFFLPSLPELMKTHPEVRLLIVGEGPTRAECEGIAARSGAMHAVRFTGQRSDIPDILAAVDVLVIPSLMEGLSFCALEAMAAGRPVAAFRVGGIPELIVHERTGVLAPERDRPALVAEIRRLLDDRERRSSVVAGAGEFVSRFSIQAHVGKLIAVYEEVLASAGRAR